MKGASLSVPPVQRRKRKLQSRLSPWRLNKGKERESGKSGQKEIGMMKIRRRASVALETFGKRQRWEQSQN
jgi:hypothetical protein